MQSLVPTIDIDDEIIIVDGGDGFLMDLLPEGIRSAVTVITDKRPGISIAANIGAKKASNEIIAFLQDDVIVSRTWISELRFWFRNLPDAAAIGGTVVDRKYKSMGQSIKDHPMLWEIYNTVFFGKKLYEYGFIAPWGGFSIGTLTPDAPKRVNGFAGPNWAIRKSVFDSVGAFDEILEFNHWDGYFFFKISNMGYKLYSVPKMKVYHFPPLVGSVRDPFYLTKDVVLFVGLLKPRRKIDKIKANFFVLLNILFWLSVRSKSDRSMMVFSALNGFKAGRKILKKLKQENE